MKLQSLLIFAAIFTLSAVKADNIFDIEEGKILEGMANAVAERVSPECFNLVKTQMFQELKNAIDEYVTKIDHGRPYVKKGMHFHIDEFINNSLLIKPIESVGEDCIDEVKKAYRDYAVAKYSKVVELF